MMWIYLTFLCFTNTLGCRSSEEIEELTKNKNKFPKYFSSASWGSWTPTDNSWMDWIDIWGNENSSVAFDSTEVGRNPESGWPRYWKGMGKGNPGVPPPPWAYIPGNYGKPKFCFLQPAVGNCRQLLSRWGFNPTSNNCQSFVYSGCGGNANNFMSKYDCEHACGRPPTPTASGGWSTSGIISLTDGLVGPINLDSSSLVLFYLYLKVDCYMWASLAVLCDYF